jgi:excisionase family DNA binding protein
MAKTKTEYTTLQVARQIGVHRSTLLRWLQSGQLREPRHIRGAGQDIRVWTARDLERAKRLKDAQYRRRRGEKL